MPYIKNRDSDMIIVTEIIRDNSTRGSTYDIKITKMHRLDEEMATIPSVAWLESSSILEKKMRLDKGLDTFTK